MILDYGPDPTTDTEQAKRDLRKFGFCLIKDAITGDFFTKSKNQLYIFYQSESLFKQNRTVIHIICAVYPGLMHADLFLSIHSLALMGPPPPWALQK